MTVEQLTVADLSPRQVEFLPPIMQWRKLLVRARPRRYSGVSPLAMRMVGEVLAIHADREGGSCGRRSG